MLQRLQVRYHLLECFVGGADHNASLIYSGYFYSASSSPLLLRGAPDSMDTLPEFHVEAPQATASEGFAHSPYVAARAGVEPMTLQTNDVDSTHAPPTPHSLIGRDSDSVV